MKGENTKKSHPQKAGKWKSDRTEKWTESAIGSRTCSPRQWVCLYQTLGETHLKQCLIKSEERLFSNLMPYSYTVFHVTIHGKLPTSHKYLNFKSRLTLKTHLWQINCPLVLDQLCCLNSLQIPGSHKTRYLALNFEIQANKFFADLNDYPYIFIIIIGAFGFKSTILVFFLHSSHFVFDLLSLWTHFRLCFY